MPAYDYKCTSCDTVFEIVRAAGSKAAICCPHCDSTTKRIFTPVGVVFKGSGFHTTDYRSKPAAEPTAKPACAVSGDSAGCATCPAAESVSAAPADAS
ncbi:MAG: FmdB family zinc ribbon protein [Coriobacteriia bacterium]|nr:FmdB family zinc ribbon protein [Coriobacteriia bacterium]